MTRLISEKTEANAISLLRQLLVAVELAPDGEILSVDKKRLSDVTRGAQGVVLAVDTAIRERFEEAALESE